MRLTKGIAGNQGKAVYVYFGGGVYYQLKKNIAYCVHKISKNQDFGLQPHLDTSMLGIYLGSLEFLQHDPLGGPRKLSGSL